MKHCKIRFALWVLPVALTMVGCGAMEEPKPKSAPLGLITTPTAYYSTPKARYLGQKYKGNLDRLVERIVRNQKTANLQFANNIASVGGIGFFTHSAATIPDERYLEVVLAAPDTFEVSGDYSAKVNRLFTLYGVELLSVLASDSEIYQEKEVSGYGVNLSWRKITREPTGPRVTLEKAVAYFPKQRVQAFLQRETSQNDLLQEAAIFAVEEDGPMSLVSYRPQDLKPDSRPPIQEENLTGLKPEPKADARLPPSQPPTPHPAQVSKIEKKAEDAQAEQVALVEKPSTVVRPLAVETKEDVNATPSVPEKFTLPAVLTAKSTAGKAEQEKDEPIVASNKNNESPSQSAKASTPKLEPVPIVPLPIAKPVEIVPLAAASIETPRERGVLETAPSHYGVANEKTEEVIAKPELPLQKVEVAEVLPSTAVSPSATAPAAVSAPAARREPVKETRAQEQIGATARTPEPSLPLRSAAESKPEPVIIAPKTEVKAPPKVTQVKEDNVAKTKAPSPVVTKAEAVPVANQTEPIEDTKLEPAIITPKSEVNASGVGRPVPRMVTPLKEENVDEAGPENQFPVKAEAAKAPDQPTPVEDKKSESVIAAPKMEIEIPGATRTASTKVTAAKEENVGETKSPNLVVGKAEAVKVSDQPKAVGQKKPEAVIVPPRAEAKAPIAMQPAPTKVTSATEENLSQKPMVAKAEAMKAPDQSKVVEEKKSEVAIAAPKVDIKTPEIEGQDKVATTQKAPESPLRSRSVEERPPETVSAPAKTEVRAPEVKPVPAQAVPAVQAKVAEKPASEQIALLTKKPIETTPEKKPLARPVPKALEGYIIQLSFSQKAEAQRWAESLTGRGFAVSMTEAGSDNAFRVRVGNFSVRDQAERQLKTFGRDGLKGIVLNLPQAYRPEVLPPTADAAGQTISATE